MNRKYFKTGSATFLPWNLQILFLADVYLAEGFDDGLFQKHFFEV
jgi:hypothetical protein